jgi:cell wall-associated NlpC family hydrolase
VRTLPAWAARYVGRPFADGGRDLDGVDCWGLVRLILREQYSLELPSYAGAYPSASERSEVSTLVAASVPELGWIPARPPYLAGDGVVLRVENRPWHVGLMLNDDDFIHVMPSGTSLIESITGLRWGRRIVGVYRHPEVRA